MSLDGAYDPDNVFARILRGEIPSAKVYEDAKVLAFMDAFPQARGHTLVVHRHSRARNLLEIEPEALCELALGVQKVTRAVRRALNPDGVVVTQFNGALAGQTIYHLHFHILPRWDGVAMAPHGGGQAQPEELAQLAAAIAAELV
jgi:histidine triad (HIT) family protein